MAEAFGRTVRKHRLRKRMMQREPAERCGLDLSYIGGIEWDERNPTLGVIHGLSHVLGVDMAELMREV